MSEDQKKELQKQLWNIDNELRGKMNVDLMKLDYLVSVQRTKYE